MAELLQAVAVQPVQVVGQVERVADVGLRHQHAAVGRRRDPRPAQHAGHGAAAAVGGHALQQRAVQAVFHHREQVAAGQRGHGRHVQHRAHEPRAERFRLRQQRRGAGVDLLRQVGQELVPQHVHRAAGGFHGAGVQPRHDVAAVAFHQRLRRGHAVAAREELEEVGAVQVLLGQRQRAAVAVDLAQRQEAGGPLGTQPGLEHRPAQAATARGGVALVHHRQAFQAPAGLEQVGDEPGHAAEDGLQHARRAAHLVEVHGVRELVHQQQVEPGTVVEQLAVVGRGQEHAHQAVGQRRREAVGEVELAVDHDLGAAPRLPGQRLRHLRPDAFGCARDRLGLRALAGAVVHAEVRAVGRLPGLAGVGHGLGLRGGGGRHRQRRDGEPAQPARRHASSRARRSLRQ